MAKAAVFAAVGAATAVYGTIQQSKASKKAASAQQRAAQLEQRRQDLAAARERRQQYRQARIQRAQIASNAGATGVSQTSGAISGQGIVGTQAGANVSYLNQQSDLARQQGIFQTQAYTAQGKAAMWGGVASLGSSIFSNSSQIAGLWGSTGSNTQQATG